MGCGRDSACAVGLAAGGGGGVGSSHGGGFCPWVLAGFEKRVRTFRQPGTSLEEGGTGTACDGEGSWSPLGEERQNVGVGGSVFG